MQAAGLRTIGAITIDARCVKPFDPRTLLGQRLQDVRVPGRVQAQRLVDAERAALAEEQSRWPARTDHDALQEAFQALEAAGFAVLQGVDDHWAAAAVVRDAAGGAAGSPLRGVVWFTPSDVWHAVDHGMLEVNVWHPDSANIADGDPLCSAVVASLDTAGLAAHFDEGRIEVRAFWHRRLSDA